MIMMKTIVAIVILIVATTISVCYSQRTLEDTSLSSSSSSSFLEYLDDSLLSFSSSEFDNNHTLWDNILKESIHEHKRLFGIRLSVVDYVSLRRDVRLAQYLNMLAEWDMESVNTVEQELALYINAYNAWSMYIVTINPCKIQFGRFCYPVKSIRDVGTSWKKDIWNEKITVVGKTKLSLNDIKERLRKLGYGQIHACIADTTVSGPDAIKGAYFPETVHEQMDAAVRLFLSNPTKGMALDQKKNKLTLSKIFTSYAQDFVNQEKGTKALIDFITNYAPDQDKPYLIAHRSDFEALPPHNSNIAIMHYEWRLNKMESL